MVNKEIQDLNTVVSILSGRSLEQTVCSVCKSPASVLSYRDGTNSEFCAFCFSGEPIESSEEKHPLDGAKKEWVLSEEDHLKWYKEYVLGEKPEDAK